jgi:glucokinase
MPLFLGLDLGGTNIKVGLVDHTAKLIAQNSVVTPAEKGPDAVLATMAQAARDLVAKQGATMDQVTAIGVGSPGPLDLKHGIVRKAPNLPHWVNVPVEAKIRELTGRPCVLENDANAAAYGEFWAGAGKNSDIRHFIAFTLGTGIGSGIVVDGKIVHGATGMAGEGGHIIIFPNGRLCGCGQHGCIESYASATATVKRTIEAIEKGWASEFGGPRQPISDNALAKSFKGRLHEITAKDIFDAAKSGDPLATKIVDETAETLALTCVTFSRILEPQMIVFAGGMVFAGDFLFDKIRAFYEKHTWSVPVPGPKILPAVLGNDAGAIGAAGVAYAKFAQ